MNRKETTEGKKETERWNGNKRLKGQEQTAWKDWCERKTEFPSKNKRENIWAN